MVAHACGGTYSATGKAEVGGSLLPWRLGLQGAKIMPLYSSLGSKKKKTNYRMNVPYKIKAIFDRYAGNIILNGEILKCFP